MNINTAQTIKDYCLEFAQGMDNTITSLQPSSRTAATLGVAALATTVGACGINSPELVTGAAIIGGGAIGVTTGFVLTEGFVRVAGRLESYPQKSHNTIRRLGGAFTAAVILTVGTIAADRIPEQFANPPAAQTQAPQAP